MEERDGTVRRLWQRSFLIVAGVLEAGIEISAAAFIALFGFHGFAAGEMGNMVGMFAAAVLLFLLPLAVARAAAVYGLWKRKRWAAVLTLVLSLLLAAGAGMGISTAAVMSLLLLAYVGLSGWAAWVCLRRFGTG